MEKRSDLKHLVVLSGAGMSAESGLATFRGQDGLWEGHRIEDVATPEAWKANPELVLDFYNMRRRQLHEVEPNKAHLALRDLEQYFKVSIITQNVDHLHEAAGSSKVYHLHGELFSVRSENFCCQHQWADDLNLGDSCRHGRQLRPDIVWFGEAVPMIETAMDVCSSADVLLIIGTSLQVYPAASLLHYVPEVCPGFYIDPGTAPVPPHISHIQLAATSGLEAIFNKLVSFA